MRFKQFPLIHEILLEEKLKPIEVLDGDKLLCVDSSGAKYVMKECRGEEEKVFTDVLPKIRNLKFEILELPQHKKIINKTIREGENQQTFKYILINYYDGKYYNKSWNEYYPDSLGGRGVDIGFSDKCEKLLKDFSRIDLKVIAESDLLEFDFEEWKTKNLPFIERHLLQKNIVSTEQMSKAKRILEAKELFSQSRKTLTNGDFYPRNFIELPTGKIVVIDWEGRIDYEVDIPTKDGSEKLKGLRNAFINYTENHAAFLFVHMWGNYSFRRRFIKGVLSEFKLASLNIQAALIIKSLEQSFLWKDIDQFTHLAVDQAQMFVDALDDQYIKDLLS